MMLKFCLTAIFLGGIVFSMDLKTSVAQQPPVLQAIQQSHISSRRSDRSGPCAKRNYEVIDDVRRSSNESYSGNYELCDKSLDEGWYRFKLQGSNAVIPTGCVPENHCTTDAPMWLDLKGQSLPAVGQEVDGRGCANWHDNCCYWRTPVTVRNCGDFFVYKLRPTTGCYIAFCAQLQDAGDQFNTGPCAEGNYEVIDDVRRLSNESYSGDHELCDRRLDEGWYRFKLQGSNAVMPTGCVQENRCTTHAPVWLDLKGQSLPAVGQEVDGRGCASWDSDCCKWETPVTVRNCRDFLVYKLHPTPGCFLAFCAQPQDAGGHFNVQ